MGIRAWLRAILAPASSDATVASRHERREAGRRRHHDDGGPAWTDADRHLEDRGEHLVADVTPGTPGHGASVRTTRNR